MMIVIVVLCFALLVAGTYTDLRKREVPDWINYSGIFAGFGLRALWSAIELDYHYILDSAVGFAVFFALAYGLYYLGQWGGGDSKMLMALGALIGFPIALDNFALAFLVNLFVVGGIYGLLWSFLLAFRNWKKFRKEFSRLMQNHRLFRLVPLAVIILLIFASFVVAISPVFFTFIVIFLLFIPLMFYLSLMIRAVEKACMYKTIPVKELTEGEWIVKDIKMQGKRICGPADLGISKKQILQLAKLRVKNVLVKTGIPFVPSFLLAFILALAIGNPLVWLV